MSQFSTVETFQKYYKYGQKSQDMEIRNDSKSSDPDIEHVLHIGEIKWILKFSATEKNTFKVELQCRLENVYEMWKVDAHFQFSISSGTKVESPIHHHTFEKLNSECVTLDIPQTDSRIESLSLTFKIGVVQKEGFYSPEYYDFSEPSDFFDARITCADGIVYNVNQRILMFHSKELRSQFDDGAVFDIELDSAGYLIYELLQMAHGVQILVRPSNIEHLIKYSQKHAIRTIISMCKYYLLSFRAHQEMTFAEVLKVAETFKGEDLPVTIIKSFETRKILKTYCEPLLNSRKAILDAIIEKAFQLTK